MLLAQVMAPLRERTLSHPDRFLLRFRYSLRVTHHDADWADVQEHYRSRRETYRIRSNAVRNLTAVAAGTRIGVQSIPWARFRSVPLNGRRPGLGRSSHLRFVVSGRVARWGRMQAPKHRRSSRVSARPIGLSPAANLRARAVFNRFTRLSVPARTVSGGVGAQRSELIYTT